MKFVKFGLILALTLLLASCSRERMAKVYDVNYTPSNRFAKNLAPLPKSTYETSTNNGKDIDGFNQLVSKFNTHIAQHWGAGQVRVASTKIYVKYIDNFNSRTIIDFETGQLTVETVSPNEPIAHLKHAIITTLLTPEDPTNVDLLSSTDVKIDGKKPFLLEQITDNEGQAIEWFWRANRFADYLIKNDVKSRNIGGRKSYFVTVKLNQSKISSRNYQYANIVRPAASRYSIDESLIYAIIRTESSFNPYAVSWANAYGLMQVVPKTAGRDVYSQIKNISGQPSSRVLFVPENNIDIGTAYLYILKNKYLSGITNRQSLEYCMISAYNGGAGAVLDTFNKDRVQAIRDINRLSPSQVYWVLTKRHNNAEARRYLEKVNAFKKQFNG